MLNPIKTNQGPVNRKPPSVHYVYIKEVFITEWTGFFWRGIRRVNIWTLVLGIWDKNKTGLKKSGIT